MTTYEHITLTENLNIRHIYSIHYFEYPKNYVYKGESHNFWEFLYVDNGKIQVQAGEQIITLSKGEMIFHKPNEFHALQANGKDAPNLIVISFDCSASCMDFFQNRIVTIHPTERFFLSQIITEAKKTFCTPLNNPYLCKLERYPQAPFGSEQLIKLSLESLLISIYRRFMDNCPIFSYEITLSSSFHHRNTNAYMEQVIQYMGQHLTEKLTVAQICKDNMIGRSNLQKIFHQEKHCGVMEYFSYMKIDAAKKLIRENRYTYSQIANLLSYSSYQYFSLQFKKYTRMTPSEYHHSIMSFSE